MKGLAEGIQDALQYIEQHLTDELDIRSIAETAYVSPFHFQRMFHALCGMTVAEYIRCRRLSAAAQELVLSDVRVLDIAVKYGYESQDSFSRAFTRFHGISPAAAKSGGANLKAFAPLRLKLNLEGGSVMEYQITEKAAFTVVGKAFRMPYADSYERIPKLWQAHLQSPDAKEIRGMFGICMDETDTEMTYLIADLYFPQKAIPEGFVTHTFPSGTWAVFPCKGPIVETIQRVSRMIWDEWLPNCTEYKLAENVELEAYIIPPQDDDPAKAYNEIWLPVTKL